MSIGLVLFIFVILIHSEAIDFEKRGYERESIGEIEADSEDDPEDDELRGGQTRVRQDTPRLTKKTP